jgi:hypothetical protein
MQKVETYYGTFELPGFFMQWVIFKNTRIILVSNTESCLQWPLSGAFYLLSRAKLVCTYAPAERADTLPCFFSNPICTLWEHECRFRLCHERRHVLFSSFLIILFGLEYDRKGVRLGQSVSINTNPGNKPYFYRLRTSKKSIKESLAGIIVIIRRKQ